VEGIDPIPLVDFGDRKAWKLDLTVFERARRIKRTFNAGKRTFNAGNAHP